MHAIALIAVYAGSSSLALFLVSRFLIRIPPLWVIALALLPLVVTGKAVVTGGYFGPLNLAYAASPLAPKGGPALHRDYGNGLLTDVAFQMVPWKAAVRRDLRAGRAPLWNPFILCGDILAGAGQSAPFHPATLIGLLLPLAQARTLEATLGLLLGALCAFVFLRDLDLAPIYAFFGASVWMLSFHFLFWTGWPQAQSFAPLPLMMAGARRIARGERGGFAAASAALFLALVGGHPESAFHGTAVAAVWFFVELRRGAPARGRALASALGAGIFAFSLAAPAVFPILEALPQSVEAGQRAAAGKTSNAAGEAVRSAVGAVFPDAYGGWLASSSPSAPSFDSATVASIGGIGLALATFGLLSWRREKWPLAWLSIFTLAVAVGFPGIADVVNRLPVFRLALNNRLASATGFLLAALSAIGLEALAAATWRRAILLPAGAAAAAVLAAWRHATLVSRHVDPARFDRAAAFAVGGVLLVFAAWAAAGPRPAIFAPAALAIFLVGRAVATPRLSPTFSASDFYPPISELDRLPRGTEPWRIAGLGDALQPNQSALYGIEDVRGYEGVNNARLVETFPLWSKPQHLWFNRVDDPSRPFLRFLNARFLAAVPSAPPPAGWSPVARGASLSIFESPVALPRAFAPARIRFTGGAAASIDEMKGCDDFSRVAWIEDPGEAPREIDNGRAGVRVREEGPDLVLDVDAAAPAWIVASETNWKGWRAREDNTRFPLRFANHAFVGFRVPAGRHRIRLEYRPRSFLLGAIFAGVAVLAAVAGCLRRGRSPFRQ